MNEDITRITANTAVKIGLAIQTLNGLGAPGLFTLRTIRPMIVAAYVSQTAKEYDVINVWVPVPKGKIQSIYNTNMNIIEGTGVHLSRSIQDSTSGRCPSLAADNTCRDFVNTVPFKQLKTDSAITGGITIATLLPNIFFKKVVATVQELATVPEIGEK